MLIERMTRRTLPGSIVWNANNVYLHHLTRPSITPLRKAVEVNYFKEAKEQISVSYRLTNLIAMVFTEIIVVSVSTVYQHFNGKLPQKLSISQYY